jgi:hypothetical protein
MLVLEKGSWRFWGAEYLRGLPKCPRPDRSSSQSSVPRWDKPAVWGGRQANRQNVTICWHSPGNDSESASPSPTAWVKPGCCKFGSPLRNLLYPRGLAMFKICLRD